MSYCTEAQVESNLKGIDIDANSAVSTDDLSGFIEEEGAVIDAFIGQRYELPVTDATALIFLRKICLDLVVYRVTKVLQPMEQFPINSDTMQEISHVSAYKNAMSILRKISEGKMVLPSVDVESKTYISSTLESDGVEATFERGTDQW